MICMTTRAPLRVNLRGAFFDFFQNHLTFSAFSRVISRKNDFFCGSTVQMLLKLASMQFAIKRNIMKKKEEAISMARTANVFARVEPEVKEQAEQVLDRLGIPMSNAVGMFLRQIVFQRGIPFEMKLPAYEEPVAYGSLTKEEFNAEIEKGMEDIKAGRVYSADEVEAEMKREFGI